jgi:hypothetical protein
MDKDTALFLALVLSLLFLTGCNKHTDANGVTTISATEIDKSEKASMDQCLRATLFQQCLKALPAGPLATKYNDWDEVVKECQIASQYQSHRKLKNIKEECRYE